MEGGSNVADEPLGPSGPNVTVPVIVIGNAMEVDERWIWEAWHVGHVIPIVTSHDPGKEQWCLQNEE